MDGSELCQIFDLQDSGLSSTDSSSTKGYTTSDTETDQYSDSSSTGSFHLIKQKNTFKRPADQQHRSIIASASLSQADRIHDRHSGQPQPFTFLDRECYVCSCRQSPSLVTRCTALDFFQLEFLPDWSSIFCPRKNWLVPVSQLAHYLQKHQDWTSPTKKKEANNIAGHIALSCDLNLGQTAADIMNVLPKELDKPLVAKDIYCCFRCPFCVPETWHAEDKSTHLKDRNLRKHVKECHKGKNLANYTEEPRLMYKIQVYSTPSRLTHRFSLPETWNAQEIQHIPKFDPQLLNVDLPIQSSISMATTQDWPMRLNWESYATEIKAGEHIKNLRTLIRLPKVVKGRSRTDLLENGLLYVTCFCIKYMKGSGTLVTENISHINKLLMSQCVTTMFTVLHMR